MQNIQISLQKQKQTIYNIWKEKEFFRKIQDEKEESFTFPNHQTKSLLSGQLPIYAAIRKIKSKVKKKRKKNLSLIQKNLTPVMENKTPVLT